MNNNEEPEGEYIARRRSLYYLNEKFLDGKIGHGKYMKILEANCDMLDNDEWEILEAWKIKKEQELKENKRQDKIKNEQARKEGEQAIIYIFLIVSSILGIIIWIWNKTRGR